MRHIGIIGMGRVGLTLALTLASVGFKVLGVEREEEIVKSLDKGKPHFYEKGLETLLKSRLEDSNLVIANRIEEKQDAYIICVGTPIDKTTKEVILEPIIRATQEVTRWLEERDVVILRSTVPIGTARNTVLPILKECQRTFHLACCPERTIEGNALWELRELPQIVGGLDEESVEKAVGIFSKVTPTVVRVESLEAAELIKLIDNTYRDLNFAFANEIALFAGKHGIDGFKVIRAANFGYPRNNIPIPGFVGGACLSKDLYILHESALEIGYKVRFPKIAREINERMIPYTAGKIQKEMTLFGKDIEEAKIFILGIAFKGEPQTDDVRGSPAVDLAGFLKEKYGCKKIYGHDFIVPAKEISRAGLSPCSLKEGFKDADCAVLMNSHRLYYDLDLYLLNLMNKPAIFFDGWHMFSSEDFAGNEGIVYRKLGDD